MWMKNQIYKDFSQPGRKPGLQPGRKLFSQVIWSGAPWCGAATVVKYQCQKTSAPNALSTVLLKDEFLVAESNVSEF